MDNLFPPVNPDTSIFLSGNVPSSKNSKEIGFYFLKAEEKANWFFEMKGQLRKIRPTLRNSDLTEEYIKMIVDQIILNKKRFQQLAAGKPLPLIVQLHFVRKRHGRCDFHNLCQVIGDCISGSYWKEHKQIPHIATQWIADDDMSNVLFIPPLQAPFYSVDPQNPGVHISVV